MLPVSVREAAAIGVLLQIEKRAEALVNQPTRILGNSHDTEPLYSFQLSPPYSNNWNSATSTSSKSECLDACASGSSLRAVIAVEKLYRKIRHRAC